jgi:hypothetical protein
MMKAKIFAIIGAVLAVAVILGTVLIFMTGGGEPSFKEDLPTMDEVPSETINFDPTGEVMIPDQEEVFWPIYGPTNSTEVIMVTGIQVHITWSDDENPPASRPFYQNMPDTMTLEVTASPYLQSVENGGNDTANETGVISKTSMSESGNTRVDLDLKASPVVLEEGGDTNLSFDPSGFSDKGSTGLYIGISCIAGHIESSRPALLRYTDRGDEITMTVSITIKKVPAEVFEAWVAEQTASSEW